MSILAELAAVTSQTAMPAPAVSGTSAAAAFGLFAPGQSRVVVDATPTGTIEPDDAKLPPAPFASVETRMA